ncbi:hypothetical protein AGMMS49593_10220 [Endomicrobiia bacterium]|nr:hypothetical protein AGMMS49593_10220 [Endomicrobiia bacterium]
MKSLKNSFNIHPHKKTSDKEFDQLLCALEERYEFVSLYDGCPKDNCDKCGLYCDLTFCSGHAGK